MKIKLTILLTAFALLHCSDDDVESIGGQLDTPEMLVLGASLEDTGNSTQLALGAGLTQNIPAAPYAPQRFSNGSLYIEIVADRLGIDLKPSTQAGGNFAVSGAHIFRQPTHCPGGTGCPTSTMIDQKNLILKKYPRIPASTLVVLSGATIGNDIGLVLTVFSATSGVTNFFPTLISSRIDAIEEIIEDLYAAGARRFLVINSTDVGRTPRFTESGGGAPGTCFSVGPAAYCSAIAGAFPPAAGQSGFNAALATSMAAIEADTVNYPGIDIRIYDAGAFTARVLGTALDGGGTAPYTLGDSSILSSTAPRANTVTAGNNNDIFDPCLVDDDGNVNNGFGAGEVCTDPGSAFYWDKFHPTRRVGELIAAEIITLIN